jgi:hypothetical protein
MSHLSNSGHAHRRSTGAEPRQTARAKNPRRNEMSAEECERLLDKELDDTFPASDPPSWTMGGSLVGMSRH